MIESPDGNKDPNTQLPVDYSVSPGVIGSGTDSSPRGILHRFIGRMGMSAKIIAILVIGGAMLSLIGFTGYQYVTHSYAIMIQNPYDAINAADDSFLVPNIPIDAENGNATSAGAGSVGSSSASGGSGSSANSSDSSIESDSLPNSDMITIIGNSTTIPVQTPLNQNTVRSVVSSAGFTHPGVMVSLNQLNTTKKRIAAKEEPWTSIALLAKNSSYAAKKPVLNNMVRLSDATKACDPSNIGMGCVVNCGYNSNPSNGCKDETGDAIAAYTEALLWYYTGDETYAQSAITILNSWSGALRGHTGANRAVQLAWAATSFTKAAEIIRYTYTPSAGKQSFNQAQFNTMLQTAFIPTLTNYAYGGYNGNWALAAIDAKINIATYTDNRSMFNSALSQWRSAVPAYIYLKKDGALPSEPTGGSHSGKTELSCFWLSNKAPSCKTSPKSDPKLTFQNGQIQETCRDFGHVGMGLGSMLNTAETASLQGTDLYGEQQERIMTGLSYTAEIALAYQTLGYPAGICNGVSLSAPTVSLPFEEAYNAYVVRKGASFPIVSIPGLATQNYDNNSPILTIINKNKATRPEAVGLTTAWETLTHRLAGW